MLITEIVKLLEGAGLPLETEPRAQRPRATPKYFKIREIPRFRRSAPEVVARLERLNPGGVHESCYPRGWHPHKKLDHFVGRTMRVREFVRRFGREAYDALGRDDIIRRGHRKGVAWTAVCCVSAP